MTGQPLEEIEAKIGESKRLTEGMTIEAGKVEEFARAIKDENPAHRDEDAAREQGFERVPGPLTFIRTDLFPRYRPAEYEDGDHYLPNRFDIDFDPRYTVNGEVDFEFERPVYVGDTFTGTTELVDVYRREGSRGGLMTFLDFETEYRDADDDLVVTLRQTIIETEGAIED